MNRQTYLILRKRLVAIATSCNTSVKFRRVPFKRNSFGVDGTFHSDKLNIVVRYSGKCSYSSILAVLAHEVRHAQHFAEGLFSEYYNPELFTPNANAQIKNGEIELPRLGLCLDAENDCNAFAVQWMRDQGFPLDQTKATYENFFKPYNYFYVPIYQLASLLPTEKSKLWFAENLPPKTHLIVKENSHVESITEN